MIVEAVNHAVHSLSWYVFSKRILRDELTNTLNENWDAEIDRKKIRIPYKTLLRREEADSTEIIFEADNDTVGFVSIGADSVHLNLAARDGTDLATYVAQFKDLLVPIPETDDESISVKFWYHTLSGPQAIQRTIQAPDWDHIQDNYVINTRTNLNHLMSNFRPSHGGQLILWHGDPGGGKTYALRALCQAWKRWCSIDYIVDPESFFGGSPSYLMQIISSQHDGEEIQWDDDGTPIIIDDKKQSKWKLLILEDSGDFLSLNAREKTGQALSRLLNVADGFIGQGLKVVLLITTNDEIGKLHPAVSRPGRSATITQFDRFDAEGAVAWVAARKGRLPLPLQKSYSLAELYSLVSGFDNHLDNKKKELGFGGIGFQNRS